MFFKIFSTFFILKTLNSQYFKIFIYENRIIKMLAVNEIIVTVDLLIFAVIPFPVTQRQHIATIQLLSVIMDLHLVNTSEISKKMVTFFCSRLYTVFKQYFFS